MTKIQSGFTKARLLLAFQRSQIAFLIGNGINRVSASRGGLTWDGLMIALIEEVTRSADDPIKSSKRLKRLLVRGKTGQKPASLPETFDIIGATGRIEDSDSFRRLTERDLQKRIAGLLQKMLPGQAHKTMVNWAMKFRTPILTTNYDHSLQWAAPGLSCIRRRFGTGSAMSDYYPWDRYYAPADVVDPVKSFAIWHVHGDRALSRSIRAGLDQYMGMVERLRKIKQSVAKEILSGPSGEQEKVPAYHDAPWLRIFMGKKLWIQGLGLHPDEVSLRWLLIQRFRYWKRYRLKYRFASGWYIHGPTEETGPLDRERRVFLESVGLGVIEIQKKGNMYEKLFVPPPPSKGRTAPVSRTK